MILIICSFILKFICFIIAASCSAKFNSECTGYTVIAAFSLLSFKLVIIVEFVNFFRLWKCNPTDTRNHGNNNQIYKEKNDIIIEKTHRCHLGFIHYSLLNDENSNEFGQSICTKGSNCKSESLHHYLFYHSLVPNRDIKFEFLNEKVTKPIIYFYQTTKQEAFTIAEKGFPYGTDNNDIQYKDYLHLKKSIFFTPSCTQNLTPSEAIICVRLNIGRLYIEDKDRFYVRMPGQIEK